MKINPKQMEKLMKQMGMQMAHIDAEEVIIRTASKDIVIKEPEVSRINMMGQETFQIAGRMARRIVCYPEAGEQVRKGRRFGLIRFGSRVELYLPREISVSVRPGQHVKGGETVMGYFP